MSSVPEDPDDSAVACSVASAVGMGGGFGSEDFEVHAIPSIKANTNTAASAHAKAFLIFCSSLFLTRSASQLEYTIRKTEFAIRKMGVWQQFRDVSGKEAGNRDRFCASGVW